MLLLFFNNSYYSYPIDPLYISSQDKQYNIIESLNIHLVSESLNTYFIKED